MNSTAKTAIKVIVKLVSKSLRPPLVRTGEGDAEGAPTELPLALRLNTTDGLGFAIAEADGNPPEEIVGKPPEELRFGRGGSGVLPSRG